MKKQELQQRNCRLGTVGRKNIGEGGGLNQSEAAPNYKHMSGPYRGSLPHIMKTRLFKYIENFD